MSEPAANDGLHLLVVEDDTAVVLMVEIQLKAILVAFPKARIDIVHSWEAARAIIYAEPPPSVTLLDLALPGSEMLETIKRAVEIDERTAVVIMTARNPDEVEKLLADSNIEVLLKGPTLWLPGNLIRAVFRALERKSLADAKGRFSKVRGIVEDLKRLGYATPETT